MQDHVEGQYVLTQDDLHLGMREMPGARLVRWLPLATLVPVVAFAMGDDFIWASAVGAVTLAFAFAIIYFNRSAARRLFRNIRPEAREIRVRFDAEGFGLNTPDASSKHSYRALHRFVEGRTALLLYTQHNLAQIVPKRVFSAEELERVRAWLRAGVTPQKRRNPYTRILILWVVLIFSFLMIWQLLSPARNVERNVDPPSEGQSN